MFLSPSLSLKKTAVDYGKRPPAVRTVQNKIEEKENPFDFSLNFCN